MTKVYSGKGGAVSLGGLFAMVLLAGCQRQAPERAPVVRPVKTLVVSAGEATQTRSFPGKAEASRKAELAFQVAGIIVKLPVVEGQKVAKGELIAQLRQDEFEARVKVLKAQRDKAQAVLDSLLAGDRPEQRLRLESGVRAAAAKLSNARSEFERAERLQRQNAIARVEFDRAQTTLRVADEEHQAAIQLLEKGTVARSEDIAGQEAEVRGLEARLVEASLHLADSTLRAPYDGVIAVRFVEEKQNVTAKQPIVKFQDVDEIDIVVDVPETIMAANLRLADIVRLFAEFSAAPGIEFPVQVREIAQRADPVTQTFAVRVAMKAPSEIQVLPGMTANVTLSYRRAAVLGPRVQVPTSAVMKDGGGESVVWVVGPDSTTSRRVVKLGAVTTNQIEVIEGLRPGERIAVAGVTQLRDGMKVRDLGDSLGS